MTELIIALDYAKAEPALALVDSLSMNLASSKNGSAKGEPASAPIIFKVGLELFLGAGPDFVRELLHRKQRVFLDLKFHDIPNTVRQAVKQAALMHVEMLTLHLVGGRTLIQDVKQELDAIPSLRPKILGVSVLTSFDDVHWAEVTRALTGHPTQVAPAVDGLVEAGVQWGVDGVVCSALELGAIRKRYPDLYTVVPGIRPSGSSQGDQARVMTPAQAAAAGASAIVVGRPITQAGSVVDATRVAQQILAELSGNH